MKSKNSEHLFSMFYDPEKGIYKKEPKKIIDFDELIRIYKSEKLKEVTEYVREASSKTEYEKRKKQLPYITPYGTFKPTRKGENIKHHNSNIIALDIDGLTSDQSKSIAKHITQQPGAMIVTVSPSEKGVKALILIDSHIDMDGDPKRPYQVLKLNLNIIADTLGIQSASDYIDLSQFNLTQPLFLNYDPLFYYNASPEPLHVDLMEFVPVEVENIHDFTKMNVTSSRIDRYIINATNNLVEFFAVCSKGNRHNNIIRVQAISSWMHYAPHLHDEVKRTLLNAVIGMYGSRYKANQSNAVKTFETAWNTTPKRNETIEQIINDIKQSA